MCDQHIHVGGSVQTWTRHLLRHAVGVIPVDRYIYILLGFFVSLWPLYNMPNSMYNTALSFGIHFLLKRRIQHATHG